MMHPTSLADEQHPFPISLIEGDEVTDLQRAWIAAAATIAACGICGFATGCLIAAVIGKRVWEAVMP